MIAISLKLPDELAEESKRLAAQIGISRTELIRVALQREMENIRRRQEQEAMAESLAAVAKDPAYLREVRLLDETLSEKLADDSGEDWWQT